MESLLQLNPLFPNGCNNSWTVLKLQHMEILRTLSIRQFNSNISANLKKLPITLTRYGEVIAVISSPSSPPAVQKNPEKSLGTKEVDRESSEAPNGVEPEKYVDLVGGIKPKVDAPATKAQLAQEVGGSEFAGERSSVEAPSFRPVPKPTKVMK